MPSQDDADWVHLFTSTIRPLYVEDAVNVLAAPEGGRYRFRYATDLLGDDLVRRWRHGGPWASGGLVGAPAAVHLSVQHPAGYQPPVFLPLRTARITSTSYDGSVHVVEFALGPYLRVVPAGGGPEQDRALRAGHTNDYTAALTAAMSGGGPLQRRNAVLGHPPPSLPDPDDDAGEAFEHLSLYVNDALAYTPRLFARVAELYDDEKNSPVRADGGTGRFRLAAGRRYTLAVSHHQAHQPPPGTALSVKTPDIVKVTSGTPTPLLSRYDTLPVRLWVPHRDDFVSGDIVVSVDGDVAGPQVRLPVDVVPARAATASGAALGTGAGILAFYPPILANGEHVAVRLAVATAAAVAAGLALASRRRRGLSG